MGILAIFDLPCGSCPQSNFKRESGENPELSRSCKPEKKHLTIESTALLGGKEVGARQARRPAPWPIYNHILSEEKRWYNSGSIAHITEHSMYPYCITRYRYNNDQKQLFITVILTGQFVLGKAQSLTVQADTVYVVASRDWPFTRQVANIDSNLSAPHQWMAIPAISLNAVSINGLATLSNRGMSSRHTAVLFEGIPVNGITTGVYDASLIPISYFNSNKLLKDGLAATFW